jgi:uncharacterized repeat protein (TIGR01451 family)
MTSVMQRHLRTAAALGALGLAFAASPAYAVGTAAGTSITNQATVSYTVGSVAQPTVASNTTSFVVDRVVNFTVSTTDSTFVSVTPGQTTGFVTFLLSHSGNDNQGFQLNASNSAAGTTIFGGTDNADVTSLQVYVAPDATATFVPSAPTSNGYVLGNVNSLAPSSTAVTRRVVVLVTAPNTLTDQQIAGITLQARGAVAGTAGATLEVATAGADTQGSVDVVLAVAGNSATSNSAFRVNAPRIAVTKASSVVNDPFNGTTNPKAIPGATVEYVVTATNTGATAATAVGFTDTLAATTTFDGTAYSATTNVRITPVGGGSPGTSVFCFAETGGTDTNGDGCVLNGAVLTVVPSGAAALTLATSGQNSAYEFRFRVKVN